MLDVRFIAPICRLDATTHEGLPIFMGVFLTPREAAEQFGVSTSTFKRLCEQHSIQVERTPGGHRRVSLEAIQDLELHRVSTSGDASSLPDLDADSVVSVLKEGQSRKLAKKILEVCDSLTDVATVLDESIVPAMWKIGDLWRRGDIRVFEEHLCTETLLQTIDILRTQSQKYAMNEIHAVGGCLENGVDSVASKMVALCLSSIGLQTLDLGPRVPPAEMAIAAEAVNATYIWTTHTHWENDGGAIEAHMRLKELMSSDVEVLIGGGGLAPSARKTLDWCNYFESFSEMTNYISTAREASRFG